MMEKPMYAYMSGRQAIKGVMYMDGFIETGTFEQSLICMSEHGANTPITDGQAYFPPVEQVYASSRIFRLKSETKERLGVRISFRFKEPIPNNIYDDAVVGINFWQKNGVFKSGEERVELICLDVTEVNSSIFDSHK